MPALKLATPSRALHSPRDGRSDASFFLSLLLSRFSISLFDADEQEHARGFSVGHSSCAFQSKKNFTQLRSEASRRRRRVCSFVLFPQKRRPRRFHPPLRFPVGCLLSLPVEHYPRLRIQLTAQRSILPLSFPGPFLLLPLSPPSPVSFSPLTSRPFEILQE